MIEFKVQGSKSGTSSLLFTIIIIMHCSLFTVHCQSPAFAGSSLSVFCFTAGRRPAVMKIAGRSGLQRNRRTIFDF
jgi:hypothetical protein